MASRQSSKPSEGGRATLQKQRAEGERAKARAGGGGLRDVPAAAPAGRSNSTGGRANSSSIRNSNNSRSSNAGQPRSRRSRP